VPRRAAGEWRPHAERRDEKGSRAQVRPHAERRDEKAARPARPFPQHVVPSVRLPYCISTGKTPTTKNHQKRFLVLSFNMR
ncbi:MAG: hypothetical protein J7J91_11465, partial [Deltaproteobacteria bacterium]|nr:hypothetical protein [Deltaproteobacteria bacterium]